MNASPPPAEADAPGQLAARAAAIEWLMSRINYERTAHIPYQERQLKLGRMRQLLTLLGQPDARLKLVHIAGTKGKGSTSAILAAILTAAGYRAGLFSSPHLERIEERFAIDGRPCTAEELIALVQRVRQVAHVMDAEAAAEGDPAAGPTYFDLTTAMSLLHFADRQVDAAILEVGLGGRLDSTNVCLPAVSVITSISFDHMRQLGNTLSAIAREKAGIIKPGVPVVSGVLEAEPQGVIAAIARDHGCRLIQLGRDFHYRYLPPQWNNEPASILSGDIARPDDARGTLEFTYSVPGQEFSLEPAPLSMRGPHQAANAAVALAVIAELRHQNWCVSRQAMKLGLAQAAMPGRVEVIPGEPEVVLDTAHNPASAQAFTQSLAELTPASRSTLILSISRDKDVPAIVRTLVPSFERFILTEYQENPRATAAGVLAELVAESVGPPSAEIHLSANPHAAWRYARETAVPGERICITGSFYLAAEMRQFVLACASAGKAW